jgi:uncharacterized protein (DUF305 family)
MTRDFRTTRVPTRVSAAGLLTAVVIVACTSGGAATVRTTPQPVANEQGEAAAIARAKADSVRHPYTAADIHFMQSMIGHHAQAIVMSRWAPTHGASSSVQTLAERIINSQQDEIATMQQWLRDRLQVVPDPTTTGMKMTMSGMDEPMLMPGMLTDAQMKQLDEARGAEFDRLFLTFMIQHHTGALTMVKQLFDSYGAGQDETVFKFASDVNVDQTTEIARMQKMLASLVFGISSQ